MDRLYIPVKYKLLIALLTATTWLTLSLFISYPWIQSLAEQTGSIAAWFIIFGIAIIPGFFNAFLITGLLLDNRPHYTQRKYPFYLPPVSVLIAAYNEETTIGDTIQSVLSQHYPGKLEIIVIDDGSTDSTAETVLNIIKDTPLFHNKATLKLLKQGENRGKAAALNNALGISLYDTIITVDADTHIYGNSLARLVINFVDGPDNTAAVAGSVHVRNSRQSLLARLQEWDYFHGIAVVKRIQSLFQGTLVAQGAFTVYSKKAIEAVGGWPQTVGEDIVLTWALLKAGYRISYAENAFVFTNVPEHYPQFYKQRLRWARGLIEAFKRYPSLIYAKKTNTPFIIFNSLFPFLDFVYLFAFLPGIISAIFFQNYAIAGLMTLSVLPLAILINILMFSYQRRIFSQYGLKIRKNIAGLLLYTLLYQLLLSPASFIGYLSEIFNLKKKWGTK